MIKKEVKQKMLRVIAIVAVIMFTLTGVTLAATKMKRATHIMSGEVVSVDATAGTVTIKVEDPKELSQLKEGDRVMVRHAHTKISAPAPMKSGTMPMEKSMSTPKPGM